MACTRVLFLVLAEYNICALIFDALHWVCHSVFKNLKIKINKNKNE